jgi:hypothetical protein
MVYCYAYIQGDSKRWDQSRNSLFPELSPSFLITRYFDILCSFVSRRMRWAGHVAGMGDMRDVYRVLVGKPEGRRPLG